MTNRREFLQSTFVASLVAGLGYQPEASAGSERPKAIPIHKAVFDSRYADSRRYAAAASGLGVVTHAIAGDITDLWFNDLDAAWRANQAAVAGMTTESALFCLERLAWDHQMRVVFRAEHELLVSGCIEHSVACDAVALTGVRTVGSAGRDWAARIARTQVALPVGRFPSTSRNLTTKTGLQADGDAAFLVSWVIAPAVRA